MAKIRLTVRHGAHVRRESFGALEPAIEAARAAADEIRSEGPLDSVSVLRDFGPGDRVAARIEISRGGLLRSTAAGVDVMGDGSLVPFAGGMGRRPLEPRGGESAFDAIERELGSGG
jgi:hypothetical protein